MMKIVYMGTPDFAVAPLEAMLQAGYEVTAVVTQPDKQKGRGKEMAAVAGNDADFLPNVTVSGNFGDLLNDRRDHEADLRLGIFLALLADVEVLANLAFQYAHVAGVLVLNVLAKSRS